MTTQPYKTSTLYSSTGVLSRSPIERALQERVDAQLVQEARHYPTAIDPAHFFTRCARQQLQRQQISGQDYLHSLGRYSRGDFLKGLPSERLNPETETMQLFKTELFLAGRIADHLRQRGRGERPVVAMDVGGGLGLTWLKFANLFSSEIAEGRLLLVVSNDNMDPETILSRLPRGRLYDQARLQYILHGHKVNYISFNGSPMNVPVTRAAHDPATLEGFGGVDVLHERNALTAWSVIPDWQLGSVVDLLSEEGSYFVPRMNVDQVYATAETVNELEGAQRLAAIRYGHIALQKAGLQLHVRAEVGPMAGWPLNYAAFRYPGAPPIMGAPGM